ncbi:MAG: hypothetical protein WBC93_22670, partial [Sulfitobacter sp.]
GHKVRRIGVVDNFVAAALTSTDVSTVAWVGLSPAMLPLIKRALQGVSAAKGAVNAIASNGGGKCG